MKAVAVTLLAALLAGCGDNPMFMSKDTLVDRGFSDGFAVGCDGRGHLIYGYDNDTYRESYAEGVTAGQRDTECMAWRRKNN